MIMIVSSLLSVAVSILFTFIFLLSFWRKQKKSQLLPPGPAPLPLLGTPKYVGLGAAFKYFPELYRKYGPVFTIWKLTDPIVVVYGYEAVTDALLNQGEEFSGRPFLPVIDLYTEGYSFPSISGERFRQLRRFTIASMKNCGMGKTFMERCVFEESKNLIEAMRETSGKPFNPFTLLGCAVGNIISCTILGKDFHYKSPELKELLTFTREIISDLHSPLQEIGNIFPVLLKIQFFREKILKRRSQLLSFAKKYIEEHKRSLNPAAPRDFIDYFLLKIKEEENRSESNFNENSLLMTLLALLPAGTDSITSTLSFSLTVISNYPEVQAKVQQEIDEVTGSAHAPEMMDRAQMPYSNAVVHEIQRVMDLSPGSHPHAVTEETQFRGFTIPKGTTVIPFLSSVLSDPTQWETPEDFNPGHFLDEKGQFQLKPAFMAFSAGKRICAGEGLARMEIFLLFSALLQKFTFTLPPGTGRQDCRMLKQNKHKAILFSQVCAEPRAVSSTT
ncbi:cytochrome P450 2C8-like [Anomaloglossus baeobatrachus]|uniref:cytochrome P450 2C8-like n=1 Tax=Anomaloglossus baeobatrachus TaxID=238106 RepID=UPI003F4F58A4